MSEMLLHEIAVQIAREQFLLQWPVYLLMFGIALVVGFAAAFVGAYAKKRGESYATKADFAELLTQLKATTAVAEEVKASISHADWAAREQRTLRRMKLEDLLQAIHEAQAWQDLNKDLLIFDSGKDVGQSPLPKVERIAGLYFPELRENIFNFCQLHRKMTIEVLEARQKILGSTNNFQAQQLARQQFVTAWAPIYQLQLVTMSAIESQARDLMAEPVGTETINL